MNLARRHLLQVLTSAGVFLGLGTCMARFAMGRALAGSRAATLAAYLDTLIPDDEASPGALELGVDQQIFARASANRNYRILLDAGCRWLDEQAKAFGSGDFASLSQEDRDKVVTLTAEARVESLPGYFFKRMRTDAFFHYYAEPRAWAAIGYRGPPQPEGFTDYVSPPQPNE